MKKLLSKCCLLLSHIPCFNSCTSLVQRYIRWGGDVNQVDKDGWTPLRWAAQKGRTEIVKVLIAAGANVNKEATEIIGDSRLDGCTPLIFAAREGRTEIVKVLTPLSIAVLFGHLETVKALIAAGADVNETNLDGESPLYWAVKKGHTEIVELLKAAGAKE